jgi:hypothetical protein
MKKIQQTPSAIASWLPVFHEFLPKLVLLGGKTIGLYPRALMEKPTQDFFLSETIWGIPHPDTTAHLLESHLIRSGFQKRKLQSRGFFPFEIASGYFREDLGEVGFLVPISTPQSRFAPLKAVKSKRYEFLWKETNCVDVSYLNQNYEVNIPVVGRLVLALGLQMQTGRTLRFKIDNASEAIFLTLCLLIHHDELLEEALIDLSEIRPLSLLRELKMTWKQHAPGDIAWTLALKKYLSIFKEIKPVEIHTWYWKFLSQLNRNLVE